MKFISGECQIIKYYMNWLYGKHMEAMTLDQFELFWRGLSNEERQVEWDKCTFHPDFD